ncbi:hypothetical protein C0991_010537 [Blastosporella zonata]|nr:hypothetical protein C0991_010537 [Blastosporella zonata]
MFTDKTHTVNEDNTVCEVSEDHDVLVEMESPPEDNSLFTRQNDPYKPARVNEILKLVQIGTDLSDDKQQQVQELITEYADTFTLAVSEVKHVKGASHILHIEPTATFSTKVNQKPLTPSQKEYLHKSIDNMLAAGIIEQCDPAKVKCVSLTTLAQKAHAGEGLSLEELQHHVNEECVKHGMDKLFALPPRPNHQH